MLMFLIGLLLGGCCGVMVMCLMFVAGEEDRRMEQRHTEQEQKAQQST